MLPLVPVTLDLANIGVLGICGSDRARLAWWLVTQLAVLHPPGRLRIVVLTEPTRGGWAFAHWFAHLSNDWLPGGIAVAVTPTDRATLVAQIAAIARRRATHTAEPGSDVESAEPHIVVVCDFSGSIAALRDGNAVLSMGPKHGVVTLHLAADEHSLPQQCRASVSVPASKAVASGSFRSAGNREPTIFLADLVEAPWCELVARTVASLRESPDASTAGEPPRHVDLRRILPDELGDAAIGDVEALAREIARGWDRQPAATAAVIGLSSNGPLAIDIVADGPHALVAGTTGSGKSELLRTWLVSLAVRNRPDELNLLLIDYKGGAALADCAKLPHAVGLVTDLDSALTARMLRSLRAEIKHRERLLAAAHAIDFEAYRAVRPRSLARLMVVIDEFATLNADLPDVLPGLV
ncbi:MAG: FtsK/SpoIIIE domain-containing protein, partial [Mycobacteriales bacterium]